MPNLMRNISIHDVFNRMLEDSFARPFTQDGEEGILPIDIAQTDKEIVVRASLPGFKKEDVDLRIEEGVLAIKASKQKETEVEDEKYYRRERFMGSVSRRIVLPGIVQNDASSAELVDGVLTLRVPIAEANKPKQILIS
ncbi:MAG: Hsp20/alpha crystallin family protein [Nitrospinae bacterium]|nr:Hsp20/alpha crystallin family protein [Nitrospinota bacterium]